MKIKILSSAMKTFWYSDRIGGELYVDYNVESVGNPFIFTINHHYIRSCDSVITELPESFCVKRCDDKEKWVKYINWLNKTYNHIFSGCLRIYYGYLNECSSFSDDEPFGTEIHINDILKHIDYMESQQHINGGEQFSKESQLIVKMDKISLLDYAKEHYPIGTKYIPVGESKKSGKISTSDIEPRLWGGVHIECGEGFIYHNGRWAEIVKNTQKLSRKGLKEIHSVACPNWKDVLEHYGSRNPLEDYIELTQGEVNNMFDACTKEQLPIVSKYLKQDDGSINFDNLLGDGYKLNERQLIGKRVFGVFSYKSFYLDNKFDWKIQKDEFDELCLIPTKKK